jgi:hypothetical protein
MNFPTTPGSLRRARTRITAVLATAAIALMGAMTATRTHADSDPGTHHPAGQDERIEVAGGVASFSHHGEILKVHDLRKDGLGMRACLLEVGTSCVTDRGVGGGPKRKNLDIYEGAGVLLYLCYINHDGENTDCSSMQKAIA